MPVKGFGPTNFPNQVPAGIAAETSLARTRFDRLASLVQLYKALGGGWRLADPEWSARTAQNP